MLTTTTKLGMSAVLALAMFAGSGNAEARDFVGVSFSSGGGYYPVAREYVPGHYETRYENIQIGGGVYETRWVAPVYSTTVDQYGRQITVLVSPGHNESFYCPPKYETRAVSVWVPGYYYGQPVRYESHPHFNIGGFFRF